MQLTPPTLPPLTNPTTGLSSPCARLCLPVTSKTLATYLFLHPSPPHLHVASQITLVQPLKSLPQAPMYL